MKTCEEYVLKELQKTQQELQLAHKKIEELETPKEEVVDDRKCIYLSDKPNYCYYVQTTGEYNWNKILKENKLTPKFVKETLNDNEKFLKLCNLSNENGWNAIGKVVRKTYDYLLETICGNLIIQLNDFSKDISTYILDIKNGSYYSTKEKAIEVLDEISRRIQLIETFKAFGIDEEKVKLYKLFLNEKKVNALFYPYQMPEE